MGAPQLPQRFMGWGCWGVVMGGRKRKARWVAGLGKSVFQYDMFSRDLGARNETENDGKQSS
jgi:hypothetical protein